MSEALRRAFSSWATVCSIGWGVVGVVGLLQLSVAVARTVPRRFAPDR